MSKLSKRVDKLFLKTHVFVTKKDNLLMRDYYKDLLDEANVKPEDIEEDRKRLEEMMILNRKVKSVELKQKIREIVQENHAVFNALQYRLALEICNIFPNGDWFIKRQGQLWQETIQRAKQYFSKKQKFNS